MALSLVYAIPDHPWVDSANGAAVRIAMTVAKSGSDPDFAQQNSGSDPNLAGHGKGRLLTVTDEQTAESGEVIVSLVERQGRIQADLKVGAAVSGAGRLKANADLSSPGVKLHGAGFIVSREEAAALGLGTVPGLERHVREYRNGRDLMASPRDALVIDLFGLNADEVRVRFPAVFQWVVERVKPERDQNNRATYRDNWWVFGEPRKDFRPALAGLPRYIATVETAKHRTFQFLDASVLPDNMLIAIATDDGAWLGVLSSQVHVEWALAAGQAACRQRPTLQQVPLLRALPLPLTTTPASPPNSPTASATSPNSSTPTARRGRRRLTPSRSPACTTCSTSCAAARRFHPRKRSCTSRAWSACCAACTTSWTPPCWPPTAGATSAPCPGRTRPRAPSGPRRCWSAWWPSTPAAPPRRPPAPSAGCAPTSRTRRAAPSAKPPPPRRRGPPPMDS
jgi:hypothetical protein